MGLKSTYSAGDGYSVDMFESAVDRFRMPSYLTEMCLFSDAVVALREAQSAVAKDVERLTLLVVEVELGKTQVLMIETEKEKVSSRRKSRGSLVPNDFKAQPNRGQL